MKDRWWTKFKKDKEPTGYQPTGDSVSWEVAMSQAITALDHSAEIAIKGKSASGLTDVARGWLAIAETISENVSGEEHDISSSSEDYPLGFRGSSPVEDDVEEEEEGVEYDDRAHHTFPTSRRRNR